jgi:hypothetical protein
MDVMVVHDFTKRVVRNHSYLVRLKVVVELT